MRSWWYALSLQLIRYTHTSMHAMTFAFPVLFCFSIRSVLSSWVRLSHSTWLQCTTVWKTWMDSYHMIVILFMEFRKTKPSPFVSTSASASHLLPHIYLMKIDNRTDRRYSIMCVCVRWQSSVCWNTESERKCCYSRDCMRDLLPFHFIIFNTLFERFDVIKWTLTALCCNKINMNETTTLVWIWVADEWLRGGSDMGNKATWD